MENKSEKQSDESNNNEKAENNFPMIYDGYLGESFSIFLPLPLCDVIIFKEHLSELTKRECSEGGSETFTASRGKKERGNFLTAKSI